MSSEAVTENTSDGKHWYLFIIATVLAIDQLTKYLVSRMFTEGDPGKDIIQGFFKISYTENPGIAFGMLNRDDVRWILVGVSVVAILIVVYYLMRASANSKLLLWSLALLAGGIGGNLIDRIRNHGRVIDFIEIYYRDYHWPVFNIADTAITIGAALMAVELFFASQNQKTTEASAVESSLTEGPESELESPETLAK